MTKLVRASVFFNVVMPIPDTLYLLVTPEEIHKYIQQKAVEFEAKLIEDMAGIQINHSITYGESYE